MVIEQTIQNGLQHEDKDEHSDEEVEELIGLLQEHELKSHNNDGEEEYDRDDVEDDNGLKDTLSAVSKGHLDGMVGEVDKFMARGGYHVLYIGSVPVGKFYSP